MIKKAKDLINPGQKAIVIFTRGDKFSFDQNGNGSTGNWRANQKVLDGIDKVIIYKHGQDDERNLVYVGEYQGWSPSEEEGRKIIYFSKLIRIGKTSSFWQEFKGSGGSMPFAYLA